jgi:hypothetical protein
MKEIPAREAEQAAQTLGALDEVFRPLVEQLTADMEPAPFDPDLEGA